MVKKLLYIFFSIFIATAVNAQEIKWQKTFGGLVQDELASIRETRDSGYIIGGWSSSGISGNKTVPSKGLTDYWVIKCDKSGNIEWQKAYGGNNDDFLRDIRPTSDGGYICGGTSYSGWSGDKTDFSHGNSDYWVFKIDSVGNIQWQITIGGVARDDLYSILELADGSFLCGGLSESGISWNKSEVCQGSYDYWVVKLDMNGSIQWQNTIGGASPDFFEHLSPTSDGGSICSGTSDSGISGDKTVSNKGFSDAWIVKLDSLGNIEWQKGFGGSLADGITSIEQTSDLGYILGVASRSNISGDKTEMSRGDMDYWILKLDALGNISWQKTLGGSDMDLLIKTKETSDGSFILAGNSYSGISGDKTEPLLGSVAIWIIKLSSYGIIEWQNTIGSGYYDVLYSLDFCNDGDILIGGTSFSYSSLFDKTENGYGSFDYWPMRLSSKFNFIQGKDYVDFNSNSSLDTNDLVLPNRRMVESYSNRFAFTNSEGDYSLVVFDTAQFQISPSNSINYYATVPASHSANFSQFGQIDSLNDFAFQPVAIYNDLAIILTPIGAFRPGFNTSYMLSYSNIGTTSLFPKIVFRLFPGGSYVSSSVSPSMVYLDSIEWNLPLLTPFQSGQILLTVNTSSSVSIGTFLNGYAQITPIFSDANTLNNTSSIVDLVTGSFDPNDIIVDRDRLNISNFPNPPYLDYIIRFQNTGNDTAFTVKVLNPIDTLKLDVRTLEFVASSHPLDMKYIRSFNLIIFYWQIVM
jgi:hypothetical protein